MKEYKFKINGNDYTVNVNGINAGIADVTVNGVAYSVELEGTEGSAAPLVERATRVTEAPAPAKAEAKPATGAAKTVTSPLPGVIIGIEVKEGQSVKRGQRIAVLEAMKMENDILAENDGTIATIYVNKGDSILEGAKIADIA